MADQGSVSRLSSGAAGLTGQRTIDGTAQSRSAVSVSNSSGNGVGRREAPARSTSQTVNFAGKVLNKTAPRGTYLNIVV
jgi:hypothetical protein